MKILFIDIETSPNLAHVWGLWQQNVGISQLIESSYVMCFAAKWAGESEVTYHSMMKGGRKAMIKKAHKLLDKADVVVHYNGTKFDIPTLNKEFLLHGLQPPAPFKQIDLLKTVRKQFKFPSNKLDYVAQALNLGKKHKHSGHELWVDCMAKKPEAWKVMEEYNKQDVVLLEKVYSKLVPWISNHPNYAAFTGNECCPSCSGSNYQKRGFSVSNTGRYQRFQCNACGTWFRSSKSVAHSKATYTLTGT